MTNLTLTQLPRRLTRRLSFWSLLTVLLFSAPGCCNDEAHGSDHRERVPFNPRHPAPAQWSSR